MLCDEKFKCEPPMFRNNSHWAFYSALPSLTSKYQPICVHGVNAKIRTWEKMLQLRIL